MDGWITIGTDIDSKKFDKEMNRLKKDSEKFAKEEEQLLNKKAKLEFDTTKTQNELSKVDQQIERINQKMKSMEENNLPQNLKSNEKYQKMNDQVNSLISKSQEYADKIKLQNNHLTSLNEKLELTKNKQTEVNSKIQEMEAKSAGLHMNFDNVGKSIMDNVKKVGKWVAAIFSIRTAYSAVRQTMSFISSYNDDISNKLYTMKMMITSALEPVISRIVNLMWKLMAYVNYISKAWFGVDLLAKSQENHMKATNKNAKELRKTLMGFDEANVLNDNGTTGVAETSVPKIEAPEDVPIPSWIKWIADNKDKILSFFEILAGLIVGLKLAKWLGISEKLGNAIKFIFGLLKGMGTLQIIGVISGIAIAIAGIITTLQGIIAFIQDPSWGNFNKILEGLTLTLTGVGIAMVAINASNPIGWILLVSGVITGLITLLSTFGEKLFEDKAHILDTKTAQEQLTQAQEDAKRVQEELNNATDSYINAVDRAEEAEKKLQEAEEKHKISGEELQRQVDNGTLSYQTMDSAQRDVYKAYRNNITAQDNLKTSQENVTQATENLTEAKKLEEKASRENQLAIAKECGNYETYRDTIVQAYKDGKISAEEARDYIERAMGDMDTVTSETFTKNIPDDIKNGLDPSHYQNAWTKLKNGFSDMLNDIGKKAQEVFGKIGEGASKAWDSLKNGTSKAVNGIKSFFGFAKGGIVYNNGTVQGFAKGGITYPKLQYCASGAIINQPGRGVPLTQAIGGERGAEGILPLTDSQQMDLLGASIARHMNINATIPIYMGNRQIAREFQRINAEQDFAANE